MVFYVSWFNILSSIDLNKIQAKKVKNSLTKMIYEHLFQEVVHLINNKNVMNNDTSSCSSLLHLNMLDLAGFGKYDHSIHLSYFIFCINFQINF